MGCINSTPKFLTGVDGDENAFNERFAKGKILGEGAFGAVCIANDKKAGAFSEPFAMKMLKKGYHFKDNVLFNPLDPMVCSYFGIDANTSVSVCFHHLPMYIYVYGYKPFHSLTYFC